MTWSYINWIVLFGYLLFLLFLGIKFSRDNKSSEDYFLGGRSIPGWVNGMSIYATALSAITFMAIPVNVYRSNWVLAFGNLAIIPIACIAMVFFAPFYRSLNYTTAYEYLEDRFGKFLRVSASVTFILFHIMRVAFVTYLPALALGQVLNMDPGIMVLIIGVLCIIYTTIGGMKAVVYSDALQGIVLLLGALGIVIYGVFHIEGGLSHVVNTIVSEDKFLPIKSMKWSWIDASIPSVFIGTIFSSLYQYIGSQDVVQRYNSSKNEKELKKSLILNMWITLPTIVIFYGMGSVLYVFFKEKGLPSELGNNLQVMVPFFIVKYLPVGISGIVLAGIFAAAQSTISSSLNSCATCFVTDILGMRKVKLEDKEKFLYGQITSSVVGILGTVYAFYMTRSGQGDIFVAFNSLIGLFGGPVAGVFILGIFFKRVKNRGAICGFLISLMVMYLTQGKIYGYLNGIVAIGSVVLVGNIVSIFCGEKS
ncbi:sodium:solute symporter [Cetobacterium ceti]